MFNALKYVEEMENAGFSHSQAEASVKLMVGIMNENFSTKADLKETGLGLESAILATRSDCAISSSGTTQFHLSGTTSEGLFGAPATGFTCAARSCLPFLRIQHGIRVPA